MLTNTPCTLYNAYENENGAHYQRTVLGVVCWQGGRNGGGTGKTVKQEESGRVFIPFSTETGGKAYVSPKVWAGMEDKTAVFTLKPGDLLVKGVLAEEYGPGHPIRNLAKEYDDVLTIADVAVRDYGSMDMQHWEVTGV